MISPSFLMNESIAQNIAQWYKKCYTSCPMLVCHYSYCLTSGHIGAAIPINGKVTNSSTFRVESPSTPDIYIEYHPNMKFLDLIIFILSSLGTWFGFVVISCNPVPRIEIFQKRIIERVTHKRMRRRRMNNILLRRMVQRTTLDGFRFT